MTPKKKKRAIRRIKKKTKDIVIRLNPFLERHFQTKE